MIERPAANGTAHPFRDVVGEVPVVDCKHRLARRLAWVSRGIEANGPFVEEASNSGPLPAGEPGVFAQVAPRRSCLVLQAAGSVRRLVGRSISANAGGCA
jgi:hypothetical protein